MSTVETIQSKVIRMPPMAQEEVLDAVEKIEERYKSIAARDTNGGGNSKSLLENLAEIQIDGPPDLSERHDHYAHGKSED